jgi:hypothetical protein
MHAEYCRIERWRGYFSSSFYVHLPDQTLESRSFRWRREAPPPDGGPARAAYDELVGRLEAAGWTRHADGATWFATSFTRFVETPEAFVLERVADGAPQAAPPMRVVAPVQQSPVQQPPPASEPTPPTVHELRPREVPPEPPPQVKPATHMPPPAPPRRRRWVAPSAGIALVVAAVAFGFLLLGQGGNGTPEGAGGAARTVRPGLGSSGPAPVTKGVEGSVHSVRAAATRVDLRIAAHGGGSWLEVRRGSATGAVLYSATLTDGQSLHFHAPRLWGRFGAASNLTITANSRPLHLQGTYEKLFVAPR